MRRYLLRRLAESAVTFLLATVVVFAGVRALPGDPARALAGEDATPELLAAIREQYGLDQPLLVQYTRYVTTSLTGDLGTSLRPRRGRGARGGPAGAGAGGGGRGGGGRAGRLG
ncbi:hypothetical protein ACFWX0_25300, partial [Nonomuraea sp. NPDC059022]